MRRNLKDDDYIECFHSERQRHSDLPLDGIRIADFSRLLPGPWSTQMLVDLGAQVVKVEQPGLGDPRRHNPPCYQTQSAYFVGVNGNKHFIALQLDTAAGAAVARRLLSWADAVVESFRVGVASRLGIDYASAQVASPAVIHCPITGYGLDGPLAYVAGHDLAIQATLCLLEPWLWALFCHELGRPDLISDEERPEHRRTPHGQRSQLYRGIIAAYCLAHDCDVVAARMEARPIPVVAVLSPEEAVTSINAAGRNLIETVVHPSDGDVPVLRNPLHRAGLTRPASRAAQPLEADTDEVLGWLGFSEAERQGLQADGTVVKPAPGTAPAPPAAPARALGNGG